ncbi:MAG: hypothetical protein ALECFALPRED_005347 [Alectoria fallacina]|uniref:Uncharacterized protein n=1 Tax=Alectoria fallacina TaxID=1903189 RepID=A0A8H3FXJ4_9LECA|nr:MAG: hypothetical protein ALECFALPRED_005347 [Alectoria fallacina]
MCKEERLLSTVKFLGDVLCLNPTTSTPTPETNPTDHGRTPEEIAFFHSVYLPILARTGIPATEQDIEEMNLHGLPPIPEEYVRFVREHQARQFHQQRRETQTARPIHWLLDENRRFEEPEEYTSDPDLPYRDLGDLPTLDPIFPILPFGNRDSQTGSDTVSGNLAQSAAPRIPGSDLQSLRRLNGFWDTVRTVRSDDARFGDEGYQSLRSSRGEIERERERGGGRGVNAGGGGGGGGEGGKGGGEGGKGEGG